MEENQGSSDCHNDSFAAIMAAILAYLSFWHKKELAMRLGLYC